MNLLTKQKETHTLREWLWLQLMVARGENGGGGGLVREFGMDKYILLYLFTMTNKQGLTV